MDFEYDQRKAKANLRKHGVAFDETERCFTDPHALSIEDSVASGESRWIVWGMGANARLLAVVYTIKGNRVRIISARKATKKERTAYAKRIRSL